MLFSEAKEQWQNLESPWEAGWAASGVGCAATQTEVLPPSSSPWGALPHFRLKNTSLALKSSSERWVQLLRVPASVPSQPCVPTLGCLLCLSQDWQHSRVYMLSFIFKIKLSALQCIEEKEKKSCFSP